MVPPALRRSRHAGATGLRCDYPAGIFGFNPFRVGIVATAALLGTAIMTLTLGHLASRHDLRGLLLVGALMMIATGVALPNVAWFPLTAVAAFAGTANRSSGDRPVVPLEHATLAREAGDRSRTWIFARYSLLGGLSTAMGAFSGGENISPLKSRDACYDIPQCRRSPSSHPRWGESPHAFVVLRQNAQTSEEDLKLHVRNAISHFKMPQWISFVEELPKTATGKVQKFVALRQDWRLPSIRRQSLSCMVQR